MSLELHHLRQVIALAEHGSFVRAAAALHLSQPALSRSIGQLEQRYGGPLFSRRRNGVLPTDLGRLVVERARDVLRLAEQLDREAATEGHLRSGRVAVGGGPYPSEAVLAPATARFLEQYPGVHLKLVSHNWDELTRLLRARELDFYIAETSTLQREPDLVVEPMPVAHPVYLFARAGHPLASGQLRSVSDVLQWPFASPSRVPPRLLDPLLGEQRAAFWQGRTPLPFPSVECNALAPVKRMVAESNTVAGSILTCIGRELESGEFVLLAHEPWLTLQYGLVRLLRHPLTQLAQRFLEFVHEAERRAIAESERLARAYAPR